MPKKIDRPVILGIVGDSASGKTTLTSGIADILGVDRCTVLCTDNYHRNDRAERDKLGISALDPKSNHIDILEQDLGHLREGRSILMPVYDHSDGSLVRPQYIQPNDYIIAEGLLGYTTRKLRDCYDVKIYLDPQEELRIKWKIHRDTTKRGYTREQVRRSLEKRKAASPSFIRPQRTFADIVINFQKPNTSNGDDMHLDGRHILRPTLPHPDFSPLFDDSEKNGLHFELARDSDGKPVDVLEINGNISDEKAEKIEELLWHLIPEASHLRDGRVGKIDIANGANVSHPLALTQLLVGYHMVKAALGIHTI
jgi:phosphoribulokinase